MLEGLPIGPQLSAWIILFMLIVARLTFVVFLMPGIGDQTVPMRVRMSLLLGVATLFAMSGIVTAPVDISIANFVGLLGAETIIGLGLGVLLRTSIWILNMAGSLIAQTIGLSQMLGIALDAEAQTVVSAYLLDSLKYTSKFRLGGSRSSISPLSLRACSTP